MPLCSLGRLRRVPWPFSSFLSANSCHNLKKRLPPSTLAGLKLYQARREERCVSSYPSCTRKASPYVFQSSEQRATFLSAWPPSKEFGPRGKEATNQHSEKPSTCSMQRRTRKQHKIIPE